jgi:endonuclease/exonuclease/phosphatase (EEP) superfamily protein YafD
MKRQIPPALLLALVLVGVALVPLTVLLGHAAPWFGELLVPFTPHAALAALLVLGGALVLRARALAVAAALVSAVGLALVAPLWTTPEPAGLDTPALRLVHLNVHVDNAQLDDVADRIERSGADVAVVIELSRAAEARLARLPPPWRPLLTRPSSDSFGLGVYARHAATSTRVRMLTEVFPAAEVVLPWGETSLVLYAVHTMPPIDEESTRLNQRQLAELGRWLADEPRPRLVVGDLNATPWSAGLRPLSDAGYRSVHLGAGYRATWPRALGPLGLVIDHVLLAEGLSARGLTTVELADSDHRGLRVDVVPTRR